MGMAPKYSDLVYNCIYLVDIHEAVVHVKSKPPSMVKCYFEALESQTLGELKMMIHLVMETHHFLSHCVKSHHFWSHLGTSLGPRGSDSCEVAPFPVAVVVVDNAGGGGQMLGCQNLLHFLDGVACSHVHAEVLANVWSFGEGMDVDDDVVDGVVVVDTLAVVGSDLYEDLLQTVQVEVVVRSFFCLSVSDEGKRKGEKLERFVLELAHTHSLTPYLENTLCK